MMTRDEHITALYQEGKGQRAISRLVGISQPAVRKRLLKLGLITAQPQGESEVALPSSSATPTATPASDNLLPSPTTQLSSPDNPPAQCESPEAHFPLAAQAHVPVRQHQEVGDNRPPTALPPGAVVCGVCKGAFMPQGAGQK